MLNNYQLWKLLVNVKFANIINIINNREVIPELLQNECNAKEIYNSVVYMLKNPEIGKKQLTFYIYCFHAALNAMPSSSCDPISHAARRFATELVASAASTENNKLQDCDQVGC